jgi:hypothetical protein
MPYGQGNAFVGVLSIRRAAMDDKQLAVVNAAWSVSAVNAIDDQLVVGRSTATR